MMTARKIISLIGCRNLSLHNGGDYWYFTYNDGEKLFETRSVMVMRLKHLSLEQWVAEGRDFVALVEGAR
jgi:hypothetical protein